MNGPELIERELEKIAKHLESPNVEIKERLQILGQLIGLGLIERDNRQPSRA